MDTNEAINAEQRERGMFRVTLWGSFVNFLLLILKFIAGILGGSAAMIADTVHSLSDFITDIVVLCFVRISGKPCDTDHHYGHGKYETMATAIIGILLILVGIGILWNGCEKIWQFLHGEPLEAPGIIALVAAVVSVVSKEGLYRWTAARGRVLNSPVIVANAWHHRSDALSSVGTMVGIGGAILLGENWRVLDPLAAVVVSFLIIKVAFQLSVPCMEELLEKSLPADEEQFIIDTILSQPGVTDPHNLRTRHIGNNTAIEVHFRMDGSTPISRAHRATRQIENRLRQKFGPQTFITTHVEPVKGTEEA